MATVLLLHGDGADGSTTLTDSSPAARTFTASGDAQISTAQSKFGGSAILLDGNGDYFTGTASSDFAFLTGDFTVAFFARKSANGVNGYDVPICTYSGTSGATGWWIELSSSRGFLFAGGAGTPFISYSVNPNDSTWHHWAVTRSGTTLRLFRDGVTVATKTDSTSYPQAALLIGRNGYNEFFNGYIDELIVDNGTALYTSDFTPPTSPYGPPEEDGVTGSAATTVEVTSTAAGVAPTSGASSVPVGVTSTAAGIVLVAGSASLIVSVTSSGAGAAGVVGQGAAQVGVTSSATAGTEYPAAELSGATEVTVTSTASGAIEVSGASAAAVAVTSSADGVVRSGAEIGGSAAVDVSAAAVGAVLTQGQGAASVGVESTATAQALATGAGAAAVAVTSLAAGVSVIGGTGETVVSVVSAGQAVAPIHGQAATTITVSSKSAVRSGIRDFTRDVSVTTMLREISARTAPLSVVATSAPGQVAVTTRQREISVLA